MTTTDGGAFPLRTHLGMEIERIEPGRSRAWVEVTPELHNPNGVVHGAVLFALADTAMGSATMSVLDEGQICASIEVHVRFLRPVADGRLEAESRVLQRGKRVVQLQSELTDGTGRVVATASGSFAVIAPGSP